MVSFVGGVGVRVEVLVVATTRLGVRVLEAVVVISCVFRFWDLAFFRQFLTMCP